MKRIVHLFILLSLLCTAATATAQNLKKYYTSHMVADAALYHIFTQVLFNNKANGDLHFDISYKTGAEGNATVNFTFLAPTVSHAEKIAFISDECQIIAPVTQIYIERDKKEWVHRYGAQMQLSELSKFFGKATNPQVQITTKNGTLTYEVKRSEFKNYSDAVTTIFEIIAANDGDYRKK